MGGSEIRSVTKHEGLLQAGRQNSILSFHSFIEHTLTIAFCLRQQDAISYSAIYQQRDAFLLVIPSLFPHIFTSTSLMPVHVLGTGDIAIKK